MKKVLFIGFATLMIATSANAGLLESLGLAKKSEPATLEEACNKDEIKKVCPEVILGSKTITECLGDNIKALSTQCATFIKKSISDKAAAVKQDVENKKTSSDEQKSATQQALADKKSVVTEKVAAAKAATAEKQAAAKAAGQEIVNAVRNTGDAAMNTGRSVKELF